MSMLVKSMAYESYKKDLVYRRWATIHGGVYVPITPETPTNPYLSHIPERDISTPSGKKLTLVNPAYMTRQVHELGEKDYGLGGHITSLKPIRPENAPDEWERKALQGFEQNQKDVSSLVTIGNETYFRLMYPMITESGCLKCHTSQGYKVGDIRGGISVSVPWRHFREALQATWPGVENVPDIINTPSVQAKRPSSIQVAIISSIVLEELCPQNTIIVGCQRITWQS
jgi:two-component system cell cycle sensor histidine kinase/response regulator CckA